MIEINSSKVIEAGEVINFVGDIFSIAPEFLEVLV